MITKILSFVFGDAPDPVIDHPYAKATTPDRLIAAHIVESFTVDFEDWVSNNLHTGWAHCGYGEEVRTLINKKKDLRIEWGSHRKQFKERYGTTTKYKLNADDATLNNKLKLDEASSRFIIESWDRVSEVQIKIREASAKALAAMKANEEKWHIAEGLLGMKRVNGALVPVKTAE